MIIKLLINKIKGMEFVEFDNEFALTEIYEMVIGRVIRVKQQVGENTEKKRFVCDIEISEGGIIENVPLTGGGMDTETWKPHGLFIPPRKNQMVGVLFIHGHHGNPVACFQFPYPSWRIELKDKSKYNNIMEDLDDISLFHFSGSRIHLRKNGKVEIAKKSGAIDNKIEIEFTANSVKIEIPTGKTLELGDNAMKNLCNDFPNCIFSGAIHSVLNKQVKV